MFVREGIPQELKNLRQWVTWWSVPGQGKPVEMPNGRMTRVLEPRPKPHKLPVNPATGGLAMANQPDTWNTFEQACRAVEQYGLTGVGFVFAPGGAYTGIDLDDCRDPETGALAPWAREIVESLATYTEVSPSGKGVKLVVRAQLPGGRGRRRKLASGEIEMYSRDRYFTLTGDRVPGTPAGIEERAAQVNALFDRYFTDRPKPAGRFDRLWAGDTGAYGGDDSRADLALCRMLARQTGNDPAQIDARFRESGLYREKWERADYRERTIALALEAPPAGTRRRLTDLGNVDRLIARHGGELRYCAEMHDWLAWDGVRWRLNASGAAEECAKRTVLAMDDEAAASGDRAAREELDRWAHRSSTLNRILAMVRLAQSDPRLRVAQADLDRDPFLLNCPNGVVDLRTGELQAHDPSYLITRLCPVPYDPAARSERWQNFLAGIFAPHPDLLPFVQRAAGYSLSGDTREECLFLLYGTGRNGKGVFIRTLMEALGDYAVTADFSTFTAQCDRGGPRDDLANMRGRHFVSAQEGREGASLAEGLIKWLTGGDLIRARRLYENSYEFRPTHKIWLVTNHKPVIRGTEPAIWSRIKMVPFDVSFEGREDRTLKEAMLRELPGVLAWAVEGCLRWQEDGLLFPETVCQATAEWRGESDRVARFLDERCARGEFLGVRARALYSEYRRWAGEAGEEPMSERSFCQRIAAMGFERKRRGDGSWYCGVGLKSDG
ncbi:MAG: hypothetical protein JST11_03145 [Acidobacteria bacterium]|nr:hypothetical protein [Acidobacteriota bacterium]